PSWLTLSSDGVLSGTVPDDATGSYAFTITAHNGIGEDAAQDFVLTIGQGPVITSVATATFTVDSANTFTFTATGSPNPTFSSGDLPSGLKLTGVGVLSGTPTAGAGSYSFHVVASNGIGEDAIQNFVLNVQPAATKIITTDSGTVASPID